MTTPNKYQQAACRQYGGGDYAHIADLPERQATVAVNQVGDTLFQFIYRELADDPAEPMDSDTAHMRMQTALRELREVADLFEVMDDTTERDMAHG